MTANTRSSRPSRSSTGTSSRCASTRCGCRTDRRATREIVDHPGAVGIVALDDGRAGRAGQPVPPRARAAAGRAARRAAGRRRRAGRSPRRSANSPRRPGSPPARWDVLLDLNTSPGFSDEAIRIYLARELRDTGEPDGFEAEHEEVSMTVTRVPLDDAVARVFAGEITNAAAAAGILAAAQARRRPASPGCGPPTRRGPIGRGSDRARPSAGSRRPPWCAPISTISPSSAASRRTRWRPTGAT